jgi:hypothetical protein
VAPQRKPKLPSVVTEHAIKNVCEKWTAEFARRFAHENQTAIDEYFRAILGERPGFESESEMRRHATSLPGLWTAFWRPMRDGRVGAEVARTAKAFAPPLLAAALARVAAARGAFVELLSLDVETRVSTLRDLFDGTLYRVELLFAPLAGCGIVAGHGGHFCTPAVRKRVFVSMSSNGATARKGSSCCPSAGSSSAALGG